ncbi:MAG: DUF882 domain-containing protein [Hyphomicrobiaceae bacterium]|nr:DUF882 domain-containing protein [Hyphomicrobiaceae bacterium]
MRLFRLFLGKICVVTLIFAVLQISSTSRAHEALRWGRSAGYHNLTNSQSAIKDSQKQNSTKNYNETRHVVIWAASSQCLNERLKMAIYHVARNWGQVRVNSTCRSRKHNQLVGGAKHSYHLTGKAADIRVWGDIRAAARYLRKTAGGYKHYGGGLFHIDIGPRRSW